MCEYVDLVKETRAKVLCYADAKDWQVIKKSNGIVITTHQEPGIPAKIFKAEREVDLSPGELFDYVAISASSTAVPRKSKFQKSVKSLEIIREIDQNTFIVRSVSNSAGGGIISPREYLDLVSNFIDRVGCTFLSCATGVDITYPQSPKYIRGRNYPSGILCLPVSGEPNKTRLVYIIHTHLGGKIPSKVADLALPSLQVSFFSNLIKALKETSLSPSDRSLYTHSPPASVTSTQPVTPSRSHS